jgi:hypothetical protein
MTDAFPTWERILVIALAEAGEGPAVVARLKIIRPN